jgi:hypothetical protein
MWHRIITSRTASVVLWQLKWQWWVLSAVRCMCCCGTWSPSRAETCWVNTFSVSSSPTTHLCRGSRVYSSCSLAPAPDGGSGQRQAPAALYPRERTPRTHCTGGWMGPRAGLDTEGRGKILCLCWGSNLDRPVLQSLARYYTDWATPAFYTFSILVSMSMDSSDIASI